MRCWCPSLGHCSPDPIKACQAGNLAVPGTPREDNGEVSVPQILTAQKKSVRRPNWLFESVDPWGNEVIAAVAECVAEHGYSLGWGVNCPGDQSRSDQGLCTGAPEEIRTPNLLIRSQMLYPLSYGRVVTSEV